jgi:hypothetical protein
VHERKIPMNDDDDIPQITALVEKPMKQEYKAPKYKKTLSKDAQRHRYMIEELRKRDFDEEEDD